MKLRFLKSAFLGFVIIFSVTLSFAAQKQPSENSMTKDSPQILEDKREIIEVLLNDLFVNERKTIFLSKKNIPAEIQNNFPQIKDISTKFWSSSNEEKCAYEFHSFNLQGKKAHIVFGGCSDGLIYDLEKSNGKWKFIPAVFER